MPTPESPVPPTLEAVARLAQVSLSTASRALRNHPDISAATIARVRGVADKIGYRPNPLVRSLMTQVRTGHVDHSGACLAYLDMSPRHDFWRTYAVTRKFFQGARERAAALGFSFERFFPAADGFSRDRLTRMLEARGIRGVLLPVHVEHEPVRLTVDDFPLDLGHFASVAIGGEYMDPAVHFSSNNQYMSGRVARRHLRDLGYTRPGIVIEPKVDRSTDSRFQAGFFSDRWPAPDMPVPVLFAKPGDERAFAAWYREHRPDCVVANFPYIHDWLLALGVSVPRECAFASLDWDETTSSFAGINQRSDAVAAAAVDMLVAQLDRNEIGFPAIARGIFIDGVWVEGPSAPPRAATPAKAIAPKRRATSIA
ncbi:MAG: LacI family DNA-binding transcriptional regulator [Burkholderiales bacterium]|nr:LacI family DNA-binding transcriptional regulator [Opitutaceae bacterium]